MKTLVWHDLQRCLLRCPPEVLALLKRHPDETFVAGGFVRASVSEEEISDVDIFVNSQEKAVAFAAELAAAPDRKIITTGNAITVIGGKLPVQFISRWTFTSAVSALVSFDFTIAMSAFWAHDPKYPGAVIEWLSACHEDFYADLAAKRLMYTAPSRIEEAGGSLLRVLKFYQRGYRIPLDSMGMVIARIIGAIEFDKLPQRPSSSKKAPYTREQAIGAAVRKLLVEVDPSIDPNHIAHLPSPDED